MFDLLNFSKVKDINRMANYIILELIKDEDIFLLNNNLISSLSEYS